MPDNVKIALELTYIGKVFGNSGTHFGMSAFLMTLSFFLLLSRSFFSNAAQHSVKSTVVHKKIPFTIRRANKCDIPGINQINLENLPENYSHYFYINHLEKWPELSIVAETNGNEMIGYALGRLEYGSQGPMGHVASVAVNEKFRGCGVAHSLMNSLHCSFVKDYNVDTVSLYCRVSNVAAYKLYSGSLAYKCHKIVPEYYEDKENAYMMQLTDLGKIYSPNNDNMLHMT